MSPTDTPDARGIATGASARTETRYLQLAEARALECNGCGDCCDSRRTDGYWTWGSLPADGYADRSDGVPLIIPLAEVSGAWQDREHVSADLAELSGTRFRCSAFEETPPGPGETVPRGTCTRHDQWRPTPCTDFPVGGDDIEQELAVRGEVALETGAFPRCTWYRVTIVREGDARLAQ